MRDVHLRSENRQGMNGVRAFNFACLHAGMAHTLLALHGFTMNGEVMRRALEPLAQALEPTVRVVSLDAPHTCSQETVERTYRGASDGRLPPPYLCWWNASDDGLDYRGWEETRAIVGAALARHAPVSVLGFSQGGTLAAAVAALSARGELPPIHAAVLVAGRKPRAAVLQSAFDEPIAVPSLHVWGERDALTLEHSEGLVHCFSAQQRQVVRWPGGHRLPTSGAAHEAIVRFVAMHGSMANDVLAR